MPESFLPRPATEVVHPAWCRDAVLYQVNTRQFTAEGTFTAATKELSRLATLGIGIVWLMPVHEVGLERRKGTLGSPYAVRDHYSVSEELGTLDDLRELVTTAHDLGLRVILDWVANHTAWDHPLVTEHPEWYLRDTDGSMRPTPWWDWDDIVELDYSQPGLRRWMTEAMAYWVRELDVDGFRCDVAGFVPTDFWETVRAELTAIKPVFMLAEWESRDLHRAAFDASYAWSWHEAMHRIATGKADVSALHVYYSWHQKTFPPGSMRMTFVTNHDKNAWEGTDSELLGDAVEVAAVLSMVGDGIPLVHNGQEAGLDRRLAFFERDPITWRPHPMGEFYRQLIELRHDCPALANAPWGAPMLRVPNGRERQVLSFVRGVGAQRVLAVLNLCPEPVSVSLGGSLHHGHYTEPLAGGTALTVAGDTRFDVPAWGYRIMVEDQDA